MFSDLVSAFLDQLELNRGRAARTVRAYRDALCRLQIYMGERDPLSATHNDLLAFSGPWLHKQGVMARSRRPYIAAVRGFFAFAHGQKAIPTNPALSLPYPVVGKPLPTVLSLANAEKLMWSGDFTSFESVRDGAILALLIGTGIRISGLVKLNQEHIESSLGNDNQPRMVLRVTEKGDKTRLLPLPREAEMMLRVYLEHPTVAAVDRSLPSGERVLFISTRNRRCPAHEYTGERRRLSQWGIWRMIQQRGLACDIPRDQLHPHAMRHLFGTELAESDAPLLVSQDLLGHSDASSTKLYSHLAVRKKIDVIDNANPLSKIRSPVSELLRQLKT